MRLGYQMDHSKCSNFLFNFLLWNTHLSFAHIKDIWIERKWCILNTHLRHLLGTQSTIPYCAKGTCEAIECYSCSAFTDMKATALWQSKWQLHRSQWVLNLYFFFLFVFPYILISLYPNFLFHQIYIWKNSNLWTSCKNSTIPLIFVYLLHLDLPVVNVLSYLHYLILFYFILDYLGWTLWE